jgi:threonine dehydratase
MTINALPFRIDVGEASRTIASFVRRTPVVRIPHLEDPEQTSVVLKLENLQVTGSFKVRGAANRILHLSEAEKERGVVACSSGNHGRAVAHVAGLLGIPARVFVPSWVAPVKLAGMRRSGAEVVLAGDSYDEAEAQAVEAAEEDGKVFIQPFDDPWIVAGQGTLGLELLEQVPEMGTVLIPLSGGGLAGGVAYALKEQNPALRIQAVSAVRARVMYESVRAGKAISMEEEDTLAEALSGGIGVTNRYTLPLIRELVDDHILVSEEEIRAAMVFAAESLNVLLEGGGAVALAAVLARKGEWAGERGTEATAVVLSGGNVSPGRIEALTQSQNH